jgi:ABC-type transport system involved in cytochrome bd biosynthesis fused ATPase/permease subunit
MKIKHKQVSALEDFVAIFISRVMIFAIICCIAFGAMLIFLNQETFVALG